MAIKPFVQYLMGNSYYLKTVYSRKKMSNWVLRKSSELLTGIKPATLWLLVQCSTHWAPWVPEDSRGEPSHWLSFCLFSAGNMFCISLLNMSDNHILLHGSIPQVILFNNYNKSSKFLLIGDRNWEWVF